MWLDSLTRRKQIPQSELLETPLRRCLTTMDVTMLGIGHMVGGGIYVLTGQVARHIAGPAIVLSFVVAGIASLLSALCYAEFGARVPKAGSAYTYTYVTIGEIWAFIIGWNIILEHMIGAAAVARTWSSYINSLSAGWVANSSVALIGGEMNAKIQVLSPYPDIIAVIAIILVSIFIGTGAKCSTRFNNSLTLTNLVVVGFIIVAGFSLAKAENWAVFIPFGAGSVIAGASRCFFAYIGFDSVATSAEETADPGRSVPHATLISMATVTTAYILMSSALTLMVPFVQIDAGAAFSAAFALRGWDWARVVVAIGALCGITTALTGHLFTLPRCLDCEC